MRWRGQRQSSNVEDRRGRGGRIARRGGKMSIWTILIVIVISVVTGKNPMSLLQMVGGSQQDTMPQNSAPVTQRSAAEQELAAFTKTILASTEDAWSAEFKRRGSNYPAPGMVLFEGNVRSACGVNSERTGPFYCPGDNKMYLALSFFKQLSKMGAPGDFAQAYVIAHEVGHHIQNITGTEKKMRQMQQQDPTNANQYLVKLELQADCYAGVWAALAQQQKNWLEEGDIDEGLKAAASIGDDTLQRNAGRRVSVETFTHGSSQQRVKWLKLGMSTGDLNQCDTFR
ncbi:YpfJ protein, zinc metalloprotease superfamily [hydrothermal vent metagenome]|uniref:YpfJ protein, zinc metalloprotease superfamily n=1 Tax=hydrothermal vent metagenome TaxID=652676 RepID=A0A3B0UUY9_9ZZZZ